MPTAWPVREFNEYLRALMDEAGIADPAELSRLTGVSQTQLSHWRRGNAQPSAGSLRKLAPVLRVPPVNLYLAAGINEAEELDLGGQVDFTVLPQELRALADLWTNPAMSDQQREHLRRSMAYLAKGVEAELSPTGQGRPSGRRRSA